jgi:hypothetical protein
VKLKLPTPAETFDRVRETEVWKSIFRPGSIFRRGYKDTSRDRALATMNNVLYHLHPVKMKRHGLKLTYTFCLGGLSFFLFILLTLTGIYLMFFYRPAAELGQAAAYTDMQNIRTSVFFGDLVRNLHRWGAHLMVLSVTLHMARVFYTGSYKPPREFNWVVGVVLLFLTLGLSFTGYLLPWDQLAIWAVTVGTSLAGYSPFIAKQANFLLLGGVSWGPTRCSAGTCCTSWRCRSSSCCSWPCTSGGSARTAASRDRCREGDRWRERTHRSTRRPSTRSWPRSSPRAPTGASPKAGRARPPSARIG